MTTEALGVDIYIPVTFATGGVPVNSFGTAPTLLSAARNGTAFTPSSTTVSANGTSPQSYGYTLQGAETTLQGAGKYTLVFQCLDAAADYPIWLVELEIGQAWVTAISTLVNRIGAFTGTGVNTVLGFFKALMSKTASTPSDVGGTFDASTDSVEAIRDRGDAAWTGSAPPTASAIADAVWDEAISGHATTGTTGATLAAIQTRTDYISSGNVSAINPWDARTRTLYITEFDGYTTRGILIEGITVEGIADLTTLTNFTFGFVRANLIVAATSDTMSIDAGDVTADSITLKPTSAFSARMTNMGGRPFKIRALKGSDPVTVLQGTLNISPKLLP